MKKNFYENFTRSVKKPVSQIQLINKLLKINIINFVLCCFSLAAFVETYILIWASITDVFSIEWTIVWASLIAIRIIVWLISFVLSASYYKSFRALIWLAANNAFDEKMDEIFIFMSKIAKRSFGPILIRVRTELKCTDSQFEKYNSLTHKYSYSLFYQLFISPIVLIKFNIKNK